MKNYKIECVPCTGLVYPSHTFEVFFKSEEAMFDFMDIVPKAYTTKHYRKDDGDEWTLIGEVRGWRECDK